MPLDLFQIPPEEGINRTVEAVDVMIEEVLATIGGEGNNDERELAMRALDRATDRLNAHGLEMFRVVEATYDSLAQGQTSLDLPSQWAWPYDHPIAYDASDQMIHKMQWLTWGVFNGSRARLSGDNGVPQYCSIRDSIEDAKVHLYPYVDTNDVAKIIIPYHARVDRLSSVTNSFFVVTREIQEAIITGGIFFMMQKRYATRPDVLSQYLRDFEHQMENARCAAARYASNSHPSATPDLDGYVHPPWGAYQFGYSGLFNVGPVYIRL